MYSWQNTSGLIGYSCIYKIKKTILTEADNLVCFRGLGVADAPSSSEPKILGFGFRIRAT